MKSNQSQLSAQTTSVDDVRVNDVQLNEVRANNHSILPEDVQGSDCPMNSCEASSCSEIDCQRWSATRLKSYLQCPRQFRYRYVDGIPAIPTAPLVFGQTIHETLCYVGEYQMRMRRLPKLPDVLIHFYASWGAAMGTVQPYFSASNPSSQQYQTMGREMLRCFLEDETNGMMPLAVELAFEVQVGEYVLSGIVDRVEQGDDGLVVVDFKSGSRKPKPATLQDDLQFTVYALAMERMLGQQVERVCYYHLRDGTCIDAYPDERDFTRLTGEILPQVAAAVERQEFAPCSGYWCSFCDYRELCRAENWLIWEGKI